MFICEDCLKKYKNFALPLSYGKCEDCGKTKPCCDIKSSNLELRETKTMNIKTELNLDEPKIGLKIHYTPQSIFDAFWNHEGNLSFEELLQSEMGGIDSDGEEITCTLAETFEAMKENGFWGFSNNKTNTVHIWLTDKNDIEQIRMILGHEIGHLLEDNSEYSPIEDLRGEQRADNYGKACVLTERFLKQITG